MIFSILTTFALTRYQHYVVKETGSVAIQADALHYVGDMIVNGVVILALVLGYYFDLPWMIRFLPWQFPYTFLPMHGVF